MYVGCQLIREFCSIPLKACISLKVWPRRHLNETFDRLKNICTKYHDMLNQLGKISPINMKYTYNNTHLILNVVILIMFAQFPYKIILLTPIIYYTLLFIDSFAAIV